MNIEEIKKFKDELKNNTIDELELIIKDQKNLYSEEEIKLIEEVIEQKKKKVKGKMENKLPKTIKCSKCDSINPFKNDVCMFCEYKLDKTKYYNQENENRESKYNKIAIIGLIIVLLVIVCIVASSILSKRQEEIELKNEIVEVTKSFGLTEPVVTTRKITYKDHDMYYGTIYCSDFDKLSFEKMIELDKRLAGVYKLVSIEKYYCNSDVYDIFVSDTYQDITKNGVEIYKNKIETQSGSSTTKTDDISNLANSFRTIDSDDDNFWYAVTAAESLVKDKLKAPSTAKFPSPVGNYTVDQSGNSYIVTGYVDAQNSFGAMVRENWLATFEMGDTSGSKYKISNSSVILY